MASSQWSQQVRVGKYTVSQRADNSTWACDCLAWKFQKPRAIHPYGCELLAYGVCSCPPAQIVKVRDDCKHIQSVRENLGLYSNAKVDMSYVPGVGSVARKKENKDEKPNRRNFL